MAANNGADAQKPSFRRDRGPNSRDGKNDKKREELIPTHLPVYMIHSSWSLNQIDKFLKQYGTVGFLRIVYDSKGKETHDLNIAILQEGMYEALAADGRGDRGSARGLTVSPFLLHPGHLPKKGSKGTKSTLFVPVPGPLKLDDDTVMAVINAKLQHLADWGILPTNSWSLNIPMVSRELGHIRSGCFISFLPEFKLSIPDIAVIRVLLTDTYWTEAKDGAERPVFQCHWARERGNRGERKIFERKPSSPSAETKILPAKSLSQRERLSKDFAKGSRDSAKGPKDSAKGSEDSVELSGSAPKDSKARGRTSPNPEPAPVSVSVPLPETILPELDE